MLTPVLAGAIKELKSEKDKEIRKLRNENKSLKDSLVLIETRLKALEKK